MSRFVAILVVLGCSSIGTAAAQQSENIKQLDGIINRYHACFDASTQNQFLRQIDAEPNMVAEVAFHACATEEQTLSVFLTLHGTPPGVASAIILKHRNSLKHKITG